MPNRMPFEDDVLKLIPYQFAWAILVALYFVYDDRLLLTELFGIKDTILYKVCKESQSSLGILSGADGIDDGLLLACIGVYLPTYLLKLVDDVCRATTCRPLEEHMLSEVGKTILTTLLVPCTYTNSDADIYDRRL